jgi:hypothetical protein
MKHLLRSGRSEQFFKFPKRNLILKKYLSALKASIIKLASQLSTLGANSAMATGHKNIIPGIIKAYKAFLILFLMFAELREF